tara:strand:+ start:10 stop:282 length:273 start_codon:yes stop_codon:yes gene_type:complete
MQHYTSKNYKAMKAKNKAKELVDRFLDFIPCNDNELSEDDMYKYQLENAKQCALICVDVILNDVGAKDWELDTGTNTNYWQEVKQEINKL